MKGARSVVEVRPLPLAVVVTIVNEWGDEPRAAAGETTDAYPDLDRLRVEQPGPWEPVAGSPTVDLVQVANLMHSVFAARSGSECAERLNRLVDIAGLQRRLIGTEWSVREAWYAPPDRQVLAAATLSVVDRLRHEPDARRLGTCQGAECVDAFVDASPAGRRRYCSVTCQNRERARAYRAGKRATAARD